MPLKYICGKCGHEMTEIEWNKAKSLRLCDEVSDDIIIIEDLCKDCVKNLIDLINPKGEI